MEPLTVTPIYAALVFLLMAALSMAAGMARGRHGVALGDGDNRALALTLRRFGNLSEYAAAAVVILLLLELQGTAPRWLHIYGGTLVLLRLIHPVILFDTMDAPLWKKAGRFVSAAGTALLMIAGSLALLLG